MDNYTVRIQMRPGSMVIPVAVSADSTESAIHAAADRMALHGEVERVDVYHGHDGWYATDERIWSGRLSWSQRSNAECKMIECK